MITPQQQQQIDQLTQHAGITQPPQQNSAWSAYDSLVGKSSQPTQQPQGEGFFQKALGDPLKGGIQNVKNIASGIGHSVKSAVQDSGQAWNDAAAGKQSGFSAGFQAVGNVAKAAVSPITETISAATGDVANTAAEIPGVQKFANSKIGNAITQVAGVPGDKYTQWAQAHPEASKNLEALGNIAQAGTAVGPGEEVAGMAKTGLDTTADVAKTAAGKVGDVAGKAADAVGNVKGAVAGKLEDRYVAQAKEQWTKPTTKPGFKSAAKIFDNAAKQGHDISETLVNNKINPSDNIQEGRYQTKETAQGLRDDAVKTSTDVLRPSLEKADLTIPKTPVKDVIDTAIKNVSKNKSLTQETKDALIEKIQTLGEKTDGALNKQYPNGMSLTDLHNEKIVRDLNSKYDNVTNNPATNNEAIKNKAIADAARKTLESKAPKDIPVKQFNAELQKQYQAADYLDALDNKKAPVTTGAKVRQGVGKIVGAKVGSVFGGGILGGVAGYHTGGMLESMLENLPNPVRNHFLNNLKTSNPEAFTKVQDYLAK